MLASQYHPDNAETGNSEKFIRLSAAHQILSDPEKRARYDVRYRDAVRLRGKIFDPAVAPSRSELGTRKPFEAVKVPDQARGNEAQFRPSAGALRGWNAALRRPSL
jgi:DnaJ-class molecular chaperone